MKDCWQDTNKEQPISFHQAKLTLFVDVKTGE